MKRPIKKTLAFILSLAIALQLISVSTHLRIEAAQLSDFDLSEDGLSIYGYLGTDENVKIPAGISSVYLYNDDVIKKFPYKFVIYIPI